MLNAEALWTGRTSIHAYGSLRRDDMVTKAYLVMVL